jgi:thiol-disulfide isomerase/thioredoxin
VDDRQSRQLARCRSYAEERGGRCLSKRYVDSNTKVSWECSLGHRWKALPSPCFARGANANSIQQGHWCAECAAGGSWCPVCKKRSRGEILEQQLAVFREVAKGRGGACLSDEFVSHTTPLAFRCALGHEWSAKPTVVRNHWCPHCAASERQEGQRQKKLASVLRIAERHGGRCLSTDYVRQQSKLLWRCAKGHEWEMSAQQVGEGDWCAQCRRDEFSERTLAQLGELAKQRGGVCLSTVYADAVSDMRWECAHGHRWWSNADHVLGGTWCPRCRAMLRDDLERMRRIARKNGGNCLSIEYAGSQEPLLWCCRKGHEWHARPAHVIRGTWCRICRAHPPGPQHTLDEMKALAEERGGQCLSTTYSNALTPMPWRCARGHEWETRAADVLRGKWCRICSQTFPGTIHGMRAWAATLGGRCLSDAYDDPRLPARWQCAAGHRFEALVPAVKSGVWCPRCPRRTIPKPEPLRSGRAPQTASERPRIVADRPPRRYEPRSGRRFTPAQVREMRRLRRQGATPAELASRYGCSSSLVSAICLRSTYADVE